MDDSQVADPLENQGAQGTEPVLQPSDTPPQSEWAPPSIPARAHPVRRRVRYVFDAVLGVVLGTVIALIAGSFILTFATVHYLTIENSWYALLSYGQPNEGMLQRAADAYLQPATNSPEEAVYWWTTKDGDKNDLDGANNYVIHFPAGQTPPNSAFWSIAMYDTVDRMVPNPIDRYSVSSHSGLVPNADGSVDIYISNTAPTTGNQENWLPAPSGKFKLCLRIYWPDESVLNGAYQIPPVTEVN
ncbi:MAG: DUF1214 domain-containing protein [Eggerthellaceae bacterium]|nr:DUF1214 domain-containing protein [Eggerthellaceae bacterium]